VVRGDTVDEDCRAVGVVGTQREDVLVQGYLNEFVWRSNRRYACCENGKFIIQMTDRAMSLSLIARAKKHLVDLEGDVSRFVDAHPYTVRESVHGKKKGKVRR
jgi:hypothetical protein